MTLVRRIAVCVLVLLLVGETSGVARAFGAGSRVHCCCGVHASARPCPCPDCPVTLMRAHADADGEHDTSLGAGRDCSGHRTDDPGILTVVALTPPAPAIPASSAQSSSALASLASLLDRTIDPARPPP